MNSFTLESSAACWIIPLRGNGVINVRRKQRQEWRYPPFEGSASHKNTKVRVRMRSTMSIMLILILFPVSLTFCADSHEQRVEKTRAELTTRRNGMLLSLADLDAFLKARGIKSKEIIAAHAILNKMHEARAWRDIASRSTKTRKAAEATIKALLAKADEQLIIPRQQFARIKKAEFQAWARANPEAATLLEMKKLSEQARIASFNAQWSAQDAEDAAEEAQQSQWRAEAAAAEAREERRRTEKALRQHDMNAW